MLRKCFEPVLTLTLLKCDQVHNHSKMLRGYRISCKNIDLFLYIFYDYSYQLGSCRPKMEKAVV